MACCQPAKGAILTPTLSLSSPRGGGGAQVCGKRFDFLACFRIVFCCSGLCVKCNKAAVRQKLSARSLEPLLRVLLVLHSSTNIDQISEIKSNH